jgi:hypothetical protein
VTVGTDDDEPRINAIDLVSKRIERMSFEKPGFDRMQRTRLFTTALVGLSRRFSELARDGGRHPSRVNCEGGIVHGHKDEQIVLARHACRDPRSLDARFRVVDPAENSLEDLVSNAHRSKLTR